MDARAATCPGPHTCCCAGGLKGGGEDARGRCPGCPGCENAVMIWAAASSKHTLVCSQSLLCREANRLPRGRSGVRRIACMRAVEPVLRSATNLTRRGREGMCSGSRGVFVIDVLHEKMWGLRRWGRTWVQTPRQGRSGPKLCRCGVEYAQSWIATHAAALRVMGQTGLLASQWGAAG